MPLNIENLVLYVKIATYLKKITPSFPATSSNGGAQAPRFENFVGRSVKTNKLSLYQEKKNYKKIGQYEEI